MERDPEPSPKPADATPPTAAQDQGPQSTAANSADPAPTPPAADPTGQPPDQAADQEFILETVEEPATETGPAAGQLVAEPQKPKRPRPPKRPRLGSVIALFAGIFLFFSGYTSERHGFLFVGLVCGTAGLVNLLISFLPRRKKTPPPRKRRRKKTH